MSVLINEKINKKKISQPQLCTGHTKVVWETIITLKKRTKDSGAY